MGAFIRRFSVALVALPFLIGSAGSNAFGAGANSPVTNYDYNGFNASGASGAGLLSALDGNERSLLNSLSQELSNGNRMRGVVVPNDEATLSAEIVARINKLGFREGEAFHVGDVLISFDCERYESELAGAQATLDRQNALHNSNLALEKRGAIGKVDVAVSGAEQASAQASLQQLRVIMKSCAIKAPYDGVVVESHVAAHEVPAANSPLITILDRRELEVVLITPSKWLGWLNVGTGFVFETEEIAGSHELEVVRIGAKVDPVSQTIQVVGKFVDDPGRIRVGMGGDALFDIPGQ